MTPSDEFKRRIDAAKRSRSEVEPDIRDVFRYCAPGREKDFNSTIRDGEDPENFHSLGEELAGDLASDLVTYYTPDEARWAELEITVPVAEEDEEAVLAELEGRERTLFDLIEQSNWSDVALPLMFEASTHGTPAVWIDQAHLTEPVRFTVVPPHELLITPGHLGYLDRFRETTVHVSTLPALFASDPGVTFGRELREKIEKKKGTAKVCWGFWLDWSDPGNPQWAREIVVDEKRVTKEGEIVGPMAGSCPLHVGRFSPWPSRVWGRGPGRKALPDLRMVDKIDETLISNMDQALMRTIIYANDGFLDMSEGIEAGRAYPAGRGFNAREHIHEFPSGTNIDMGWFTEERIEQRLRAAFFQDGPRQRGDTPPSATQWLDERRRVQQRLGKPAAPLWTEFFYPILQRVEQLGVAAGKLPQAILYNGQTIHVRPMSPLQKAQDQDKVVIARSNLDLAAQVFGEGTAEVIDPRATFRNVVKASGDELTVIRAEEPQTAKAPVA